MFSVWKEVYLTLHHNGLLALPVLVSGFAADFFQWRYKKTGCRTTMIVLICFHLFFLLGMLSLLVLNLIFTGDLVLFTFGIGYGYFLYRRLLSA